MYIDGFVLPLRDDKQAESTAMAEKFAHRARALGALASVKGLGDGLEHGHTTDFFRAVKAEDGEDGEDTVFSFMPGPDRATRRGLEATHGRPGTCIRDRRARRSTASAWPGAASRRS